ncbi:MAG: parB-like protein partition protein chromosome partitioning protein ParB family [Candidatus Parcubacteria bacterium]|jgi:ParB family chromosome partitioning protein
MLGKGLESLIPNKKGDASASGGSSASNPPSSEVQPAHASGNEGVDFVFLQANTDPSVGVAVSGVAHAGDDDAALIEPYDTAQEHEVVLANVASPAVDVRATLAATDNAETQSLQPSSRKDAQPSSLTPARKKEIIKPEAKFPDAVFHIETHKIVANPLQPRRYFDEEAINELAASIREFGILQPIVVTKLVKESDGGADVEYQLIAGERRLLAARKLGMQTVPAIIKNVDIERERLELAIIENLQRENLSAIEMARAFARLQDEFRVTQREIAARLGKSRETVANTMRLLDLPPAVQQAIEEGKISESHGRLLLGVGDVGAQDRLFNDLLHKKMTTRELKSKLKNIEHEQKKGNPQIAQIKFVEEKLSADLGAPVRISVSGESGKIIINYYSKEELDQIIQKLRIQEGMR